MRHAGICIVVLISGCLSNSNGDNVLELKYLDPGMTFMVMNTCENFEMLVSPEEINTRIISDPKAVRFVHSRLSSIVEKDNDPLAVEPEAHAKAVLIVQSDTIEFCYGLTDCFIVGDRTVCDSLLHRFMYELTWDEKY